MSDYNLEGKRVWVAGSRGMVGSALTRELKTRSAILIEPTGPRLDLRRQAETEEFLMSTRPDAVFMAAARVGGVLANATRPVDFLYDNLMIQTNVLHAAQRAGVQKLLFLGSTCIYPRDAAQPISEDALLTGPLETTNEWYAIAKIAGIKLCQAMRDQYGANFISAMPTNLYGPKDNFDLMASHVLPALMRKIHEAKHADAAEVVIWYVAARVAARG
jgi:GDP-L-fucose synthase